MVYRQQTRWPPPRRPSRPLRRRRTWRHRPMTRSCRAAVAGEARTWASTAVHPSPGTWRRTAKRCVRLLAVTRDTWSGGVRHSSCWDCACIMAMPFRICRVGPRANSPCWAYMRLQHTIMHASFSGRICRGACGSRALVTDVDGECCAAQFLRRHVRMEDVREYIRDVLIMYSSLQSFQPKPNDRAHPLCSHIAKKVRHVGQLPQRMLAKASVPVNARLTAD